MASTEPESNSEVSAAADTSEEAAAPGKGTQTGTEKVTESGGGSPKDVPTLAGGVIGAEVPAATRVTESKATTLESAPEAVAAAKAEPQKAEKAQKPEPASGPSPEPPSDTTATPATEPETTATPARATATATPASTAAASTSHGIPALTAVLGSLTRSRTRTRTSSDATAAVSAAGGNGPGGTGTEEGPAPGKVSRPMVAAAAIGGVVLLSLPFVVASATGGDGPKHTTKNAAAGYTDPGQGSDGYVPGADATNGASRSGGSKKKEGSARDAGAPPITEAASADSASGPGEKPADGKKGDGRTGDGAKGDGKDSASDKGKDDETSGSSSDGGGATSHRSATNSAAVFSAVGGPHCSSSSVTYAERGAYTDDQDGWTTHDGSYASGGCTGRYRSMPMSGSSSKDSGNSVIWVFRTGKVTSGSCKVSVYIPDDSVARHVGGQPSYYTVHNGTDGNATLLGRFTITQVSHRGQWVGASTYKITGGLLTVKLHDRGDDWSSSSRDNAHHAVSAVRVECTA
ncbi:hypothetical protein [Streptomyces sp. NBC_00388]|uniref:hypothetical protein n=1 Tax=Streptomyces sp. NBC_00388 TaxID=2975735 RepID=UPI002E232B89